MKGITKMDLYHLIGSKSLYCGLILNKYTNGRNIKLALVDVCSYTLVYN